ncbi:uncharacterized protein LOC117113476 [Anneissia japonica]|uniref:uncharacterized protein LOC117113476 n=1 Tax=Anneissia japonica TaxID=1529436 RepID=UPI001425710C|nr:uncharacterized protein LOC117113476 [Anneissia japonica]
MNFEEVRRNPVFFENRFVVEGDDGFTDRGEGRHVPQGGSGQQLVFETESYPPHGSFVVDGQPRHIPVKVVMDATTVNCYTNLDKTHLSHTNLTDKIRDEIHDMKQETVSQLKEVQTDNQQSFCSEPILARLNYDKVNFTIIDTKDDAPKYKDPLEYGQVCLTEKRLFFVSQRKKDYTVHLHHQAIKKIKGEIIPKDSKKAKESTQTVTNQKKPKAYMLKMGQDTGSSYYEMIPIWNIKSVSMNTSGSSVSHTLIYSKNTCCGVWCGCCNCFRKLFCCCSCKPSKTWRSNRANDEALFAENHDGNLQYIASVDVKINRRVLIHVTLPAWEQRAIVEVIVDVPTSIDKIADFIRVLQHYSQDLNTPSKLSGIPGHILTISDNIGFQVQGHR